MKIIVENDVVVLLADNDMYITDGESFGTVVRLGKEDSAERWSEISKEDLIVEEVDECFT